VLVDKPAGMTSHDVVQRVRRALGTRAAGHTGTLDPFATGLLVILVGRATRLARFVEGHSKTYLATARLGIQTSTDDLTGQIVATSPLGGAVPEVQVRDALADFQGSQRQQPPQYSAKRVGGERSYRKARRGEAVELADVPVTVHRVELVEYQPPELTFRTTVSAGTYIRAIARDLGERLGVGAHLTRLRREAIGPLRVEESVTLDQVESAVLLPPHALLRHLPSVTLDAAERQAVAHGRPVVDRRALGEAAGRVPASGWLGSGAVALMSDGHLVAVAAEDPGWLRPVVVLDSA
jgi:tRNA pseudouridine55 synthase